MGRFTEDEEALLRIVVENGIYVVRSNRVGDGRVIDIKPYQELKGIDGDYFNLKKV